MKREIIWNIKQKIVNDIHKYTLLTSVDFARYILDTSIFEIFEQV
jgi:hypothetical protein